MEEKTGRTWLQRILDFINPLRDPSLTVALVLTFIEEVGQHSPWYVIIVVALVNWLAVRGIVWLIVNFTFASTFIGRRLWWAVTHPRLAWRILDAIGHEEIVIGGGLADGVVIQDGTAIVSPALSASGIHIIGELPAGAEVPMLGMPNGQMAPDLSSFAGSGFFPNSSMGGVNGFGGNGFPAQPNPAFQPMGNGYVNAQNSEGFSQNFSQRPSEEEERLRQQLAAFTRLIDDWVHYTEDKWRTVSDSQLGWKPLRGRWSSWEDIFQDVYAAKTSDPMARAAQTSGEATARRFETSKEKGSAASAVACFMRDMMTLRNGLEMMNVPINGMTETTGMQSVPFGKQFGGGNSGALSNGMNNTNPRNTFIRRPAQIFVDADTEK